MPYRRLCLFSLLAGCFLTCAAQQPTKAPTPVRSASGHSTAAATVDEEFVQKQFGKEFSLDRVSTPFMRDLDGDGVEDLVIVARSRKPMLDAAEHNYKVVDPYYGFYGFGDPKLTATFGSEELLEKNLVILVIHGAGGEAWRSDDPKSKFVIINIPLKKASVRRLQQRKKQINAIFAEEADSSAGDSVIFWDGKQYKYQPLGGAAD